MRLAKIKLDRDAFVDALASWMRWRGHAIPHNMLSKRFPLSSGEVTLTGLKKACRSVGVQIALKKRNKVMPKPENFPLLALMADGGIRAVRQMDMQGRLVTSQVGGEAAILAEDEIIGWLQASVTPKRLHQQILGAASAEHS